MRWATRRPPRESNRKAPRRTSSLRLRVQRGAAGRRWDDQLRDHTWLSGWVLGIPHPVLIEATDPRVVRGASIDVVQQLARDLVHGLARRREGSDMLAFLFAGYDARSCCAR